MRKSTNVLNLDNLKLNIPTETAETVLVEYMKKAQLELIKKAHPYKITPPKKEGGRWQTYVKDLSQASARKQIKAPSEDALYEALAEYYLTGETFCELFCEWLNYLDGYGKTGGTLQRHEQRYDKYFASSKIADMSIRNVNILTLEAECNRIVTDFNLTRHEWQQAKTILIGVFKYAVKKGMIAKTPMEQVEIGVKCKQVNKKSSETQVYQTDEFNDLTAYLETKYTETEDDSFLAILFGLYTGVRVGELAALQFGDIEDKRLHIVREETRRKTKVNGKWESTCVVVPHTKTDYDRFVTLLPQAFDVLRRLWEKHPRHKPSDYLFTRDGERLRERQLAYVLEKFSERKGKRTKSTHKMRKTYASRLVACGVPIEHVRQELGHRYLSSTYDYIFNPFTSDETYELMTKAFDKNPVLNCTQSSEH